MKSLLAPPSNIPASHYENTKMTATFRFATTIAFAPSMIASSMAFFPSVKCTRIHCSPSFFHRLLLESVRLPPLASNLRPMSYTTDPMSRKLPIEKVLPSLFSSLKSTNNKIQGAFIVELDGNRIYTTKKWNAFPSRLHPNENTKTML